MYEVIGRIAVWIGGAFVGGGLGYCLWQVWQKVENYRRVTEAEAMVDAMQKTYDADTSTLRRERDSWKERALHAERKLEHRTRAN